VRSRDTIVRVHRFEVTTSLTLYRLAGYCKHVILYARPCSPSSAPLEVESIRRYAGPPTGRWEKLSHAFRTRKEALARKIGIDFANSNIFRYGRLSLLFPLVDCQKWWCRPRPQRGTARPQCHLGSASARTSSSWDFRIEGEYRGESCGQVKAKRVCWPWFPDWFPWSSAVCPLYWY